MSNCEDLLNWCGTHIVHVRVLHTWLCQSVQTQGVVPGGRKDVRPRLIPHCPHTILSMRPASAHDSTFERVQNSHAAIHRSGHDQSAPTLPAKYGVAGEPLCMNQIFQEHAAAQRCPSRATLPYPAGTWTSRQRMPPAGSWVDHMRSPSKVMSWICPFPETEHFNTIIMSSIDIH